jgi:hypothetical protein
MASVCNRKLPFVGFLIDAIFVGKIVACIQVTLNYWFRRENEDLRLDGKASEASSIG